MLLDPLTIILHVLPRTACKTRECALAAASLQAAQSMLLLLNSPGALSPRDRPVHSSFAGSFEGTPTFARYSAGIGSAPQPRNREPDHLSSAYRTLVVSAHPRLRSVLTVKPGPPHVHRRAKIGRGDVERSSVNRIPLR
jgi:hypothetical protein